MHKATKHYTTFRDALVCEQAGIQNPFQDIDEDDDDYDEDDQELEGGAD